jgi:hypothetical protein
MMKPNNSWRCAILKALAISSFIVALLAALFVAYLDRMERTP